MLQYNSVFYQNAQFLPQDSARSKCVTTLRVISAKASGILGSFKVVTSSFLPALRIFFSKSVPRVFELNEYSY